MTNEIKEILKIAIENLWFIPFGLTIGALAIDALEMLFEEE